MSCIEDLLKHPDTAPCIVEDTVTHSYGEMVQAVRTTRTTFTESGISSGSVVALHAHRETPSLVALLTLLEMGCSVLLTNTRWPQGMVSEAIARVAARYIVTPRALNDLWVQPVSNPPIAPSWATEAAVIVPTSGSTGVPKLALLSLSSLLISARTAAPACALTSDDRWHLSLPLFHVGGLGILFRTLVTGSSLSLAREYALGEKGLSTHLSLVPTQLYRLLKDPASREMLRHHKAIMLGGAPIGARIISESRDLGIPIMTTYGLTEMGSAVTLATSALLTDRRVVSLGRPLPGREVKLSAEGEVLTRGETLFQGYITSEGLTLPLTEGGWFSTGDIGEILSDGTLAIVGRRDAQFISGGENIHPEMIENALTSLPEIAAACVVPIADQEFGHRPFAFVVSDRTALDIEEIRASLRPLVPSFALPVRIQEAPPTLLTPTGKINRALASRAVIEDGH